MGKRSTRKGNFNKAWKKREKERERRQRLEKQAEEEEERQRLEKQAERKEIIETYNLEPDTDYNTAKNFDREHRKQEEERKIYEFERKQQEERRKAIIETHNLEPDTDYNTAENFDREHRKQEEEERKEKIAQEKRKQELRLHGQRLGAKFNLNREALDPSYFSFLESLESVLEKSPFNDVLPGVAKRDGEYSLLLIDDLTAEYVQIYEISSEEGLTKLVETNKARPMKLESVINSDIDFLRNNSEFYDNSIFVRSDGVPIDQNSESHKICKELYESARNGESILPHKDGVSGATSGRGYSIGFISTRNKRDPIFRTEGQEYLEDMNPDKIIEGGLLGDGDITIAYVFKDHVIIEAKDLDKATYVIAKDRFDELKDLSRWEAMRLTSEEGLITRIFHEDVNGENFNSEKWKERIMPYLN